MEALPFSPELDCDVWLRFNCLNPEQASDLGHALYQTDAAEAHFKLSKTNERRFVIAGDHSTLIVPHDGYRQYLLFQLRELTVRGMRRAWRSGALSPNMARATSVTISGGHRSISCSTTFWPQALQNGWYLSPSFRR